MDLSKAEIKGHNIVLVGDFNPKIFQPAWFAAENLIQGGEADKAEIKIIHPDLVDFSLDWLYLQVTRERFMASTLQEPYDVIIRDLVIGAFRLLHYTPINKMGINRRMHFRVQSEEIWHAVGHKLAPKDEWQGVLDNPGLMSLVMMGNKERDDYKGHINVKIEPSKKVHPGLHFDINDHYEVKDPDKSMGGKEIIDILENNWTISYKRANFIIESLLEKLL